MTRLSLAALISACSATAAGAQKAPEAERWALVYAGCIALPTGEESCASNVQRVYFPSKGICELQTPAVMAVNTMEAHRRKAVVIWSETWCRNVGAYKPQA